MNANSIIGIVGNLGGSICGAYVVDTVLKTFSPSDISKIGKVAWIVGGTLIGGIVGDACGEYVEDTIDQITDIFGKKTEEPESETE